MKKFLSILLTILMIVTAVPMAVAAVEDADVYTHDISAGSITITPTGYSVADGEETAFTGSYVITGSNHGEDYSVTVESGTEDTVFDITFAELTIEKNDRWYAFPVAIYGKGTVNLTLEGINMLSGGNDCCGICLGDSATLVITDKSSGSLEAVGKRAAGIGVRGQWITSANIIINGGTVTATGGDYGAGIGGSLRSIMGNIIINGGTVTATGGDYGAGIGGGQSSTEGNIIINGGTVTATGGDFGAGIGPGAYGEMDTIKIVGGTVNATAGYGSDESVGMGYKCTLKCKFENYEKVSSATCTENEKLSSKCSYCDNVDVLEIENTALGHTESDVYSATSDCHYKNCTRCDYVFENTREAHQFTEEIIKEPTETESGLKRVICTICGVGYEKEIPAEGTTDPTPGTGELEPGTPDEPTEDTCDRCGFVHTNIFQQLICLLMDLMNRVLDMLIGIFI